MRPARHIITAGVLVAALGLAPRVASAQSSTTGSDQSQQTPPPAGTQAPSSEQPPSTQTPSTPPSPSGGQTATPNQPATGQSSASGVDEAKARDELAAARQSLADLTKLPAATQLQGEQRTAITNFISAFNTFATASTDWKPKFNVVDEQLSALLAGAEGGATGTSGAPSAPGATTPSTPDANAPAGTTGSAGSTAETAGAGSTAGGGYDPSIVAKLQEVRQHLDAFQMAIGDPDPHIKAIEKILADAGGGGSSAVGTSGTAAASAGGGVTLTSAQVDEIRQHLEAVRAAANH
jgi:hypothetical protein